MRTAAHHVFRHASSSVHITGRPHEPHARRRRTAGRRHVRDRLRRGAIAAYGLQCRADAPEFLRARSVWRRGGGKLHRAGRRPGGARHRLVPRAVPRRAQRCAAAAVRAGRDCARRHRRRIHRRSRPAADAARFPAHRRRRRDLHLRHRRDVVAVVAAAPRSALAPPFPLRLHPRRDHLRRVVDLCPGEVHPARPRRKGRGRADPRVAVARGMVAGAQPDGQTVTPSRPAVRWRDTAVRGTCRPPPTHPRQSGTK